MEMFNNLIDIGDCFLKKKKPKQILRDMQNIEKVLTYILSLIITTKRSWKGLPPELECRKYILEYIEYWYGCGVLLKKNDLYYFLPAYLASKLNVYGESVEVFAYGLNGASFGRVFIRDEYDVNLKLVNKQNAVLLRNNYLNIPQYYFNKKLIARLVYIWQTLGIQNGLSRIKLLVYANSDLSTKVDDIISGIIQNPDFTCVIPNEISSSIMDDTKDSNFGGTYNPQDCWYDFDKTFNLLLTFNGIKNNIETNKKERQTVKEVTSGDTLTEYSTTIANETRDIFVKEVKDIFNLSLSYEDTTEKRLEEKEREQAMLYQGGGESNFQNNENKNDLKSPTPKNNKV